MSYSLWLHGLQLTRLLCPWNFPGKNTGMGCHAFLKGIFPTQGLNACLLHLLHWWAGPLVPLEIPTFSPKEYLLFFDDSLLFIKIKKYFVISGSLIVQFCLFLLLRHALETPPNSEKESILCYYYWKHVVPTIWYKSCLVESRLKHFQHCWLAKIFYF